MELIESSKGYKRLINNKKFQQIWELIN